MTALKQLFFTSTEFWKLHRVTAVFFAVVLVIAFLLGGVLNAIPVLTAFIGYLTGLAVLAYRNRFVLRVLMPYYMGSMLVVGALLIIVLKRWRFETIRDRVVAVVTGVSLAVMVVFMLLIGRVQFAYIRSQNHIVNTISFMIQSDISDYCRNHPENRYVLDMSYARFVSTDIFESKYYRRANHVYSGSWYSNTPTMMKYSSEYIGNECCFLVYEAQEYLGREGIEFYSKNMSAEAVLEEKFKISTGATMWVYRIKRNQ